MPKSQVVDPKAVRKPDILKLKDIPVNQYKGDIKKEIDLYGKDKLKRIWYDMVTIREFETMLNTFKTQGTWNGIEYNHKGPAHLSLGQEASSVGQCVNLTTDDYIFGSHRSHGEILAKCYSAIWQLDEKKLEEIMKGFLGGETLAAAEKASYKNVKDLAENFVLYGTLAEIFARKAGFNRGLGGSMHAFFTPFGSMPNNAIVGGSADIATGSALYKRINKKPGIVIANIGDASMGCGPVWEAMMMAAMDQYNTLWPKDAGGAPPILFNFFDNFYGMGGQTVGETMGYGIMARVGAGVNPENMHSERVDGYNPLAVADAITRKKAILLAGKGPVLLDTMTYRVSGHSPSDASSYRTPEEVKLWQEADSIESYGAYLIENKIADKAELENLRTHVSAKLLDAVKLATNNDVSPRLGGAFIESVMFSNGKVEKLDDRKSDLSQPLADNARVKALAGKSRYGFDAEGKPVSKNKVYQYRDGLFEAMAHRFATDPTMAAWGEDNRDWGGAFAVYRGLTELLPYNRFFNSPISEGAIVGSGVGYALSGGRAVVELMYCDFLGRAGDEIFNQASKWQSMSAGLLKMPLVIRVSVGNKYGAQHSQDWAGLVAHIPGLKAYFPATPYDAKGMLNLALRGTDPVIFFESQLLYDVSEQFEKSGVPEGYYEVPEGEPAIRRQGKDLTIVTLGATLYKAMDVAKKLQADFGLEAEIIDLRFINPLNYEKIIESVKKTGKLLLTSDAAERGSYLHTVASNIQTMAFDYLDAPVAVVGSRNWITPAAEMEELYFPQINWIIDAIHERILPLKGYQSATVQTTLDLIRRNRQGV
ncbi:alpha-ketoacid dehydrogenase subunit alpha/beta [Treponema primitia]|uniref:alpha-ketoacid dehydrogenase subunit alpha/beta n=1 Tax=Treponema primitia TaxID=88058 RepID=UPI0002554F4D|nr:alpha-ketoacid dehydrogenase subunit alpha/beta [Treponema primitia]